MIRDKAAMSCAQKLVQPLVDAGILGAHIIPYVAMTIQNHVKADEMAQANEAKVVPISGRAQ